MRSTTILRWLAVLPAAIVAGWVAHMVFGLVSAAVAGLVGEAASYYLRLLLYYAPKNAAFVLAGAFTSPRPLPTAIVLAVVSIGLSLVIHILGQQRVGPTNYWHFAAEAFGALLGIVFAYVVERRRLRDHRA
jgi:hypothetical protein